MRKNIGMIFFLLLSNTLVSCAEHKEIIFENLTVVYDGQPHKLEVLNLSKNMKVTYFYTKDIDADNENYSFVNIGEYSYRVEVTKNNKSLGEFEATLKIIPKDVTITVSNIEEYLDGSIEEVSYSVDGVVDGDVLGESLYYTDNQVAFTWENKNYNVVVINGQYKKNTIILDSYTQFEGYDFYSLAPALCPIAFMDTSLIEQKNITSLSFIYAGKEEEYNGKLILTLYIVKNDFSTKKNECTEDNGKKIEIDLTDKLINCSYGDLVTLDNLNISISEGETLVFGDESMKFYLGYIPGEGSYRVVRNIFDTPMKSYNSLPIILEGYFYL